MQSADVMYGVCVYQFLMSLMSWVTSAKLFLLLLLLLLFANFRMIFCNTKQDATVLNFPTDFKLLTQNTATQVHFVFVRLSVVDFVL